jgi:hypothetical protein
MSDVLLENGLRITEEAIVFPSGASRKMSEVLDVRLTEKTMGDIKPAQRPSSLSRGCSVYSLIMAASSCFIFACATVFATINSPREFFWQTLLPGLGMTLVFAGLTAILYFHDQKRAEKLREKNEARVYEVEITRQYHQIDMILRTSDRQSAEVAVAAVNAALAVRCATQAQEMAVDTQGGQD